MVFGWGKKKDVIEHEVEPIEPVTSEIKLTEIPKIIDNIENLRQKTLVSEIKVFRNKIDSDRKNLLSIANKLKNDNLKTDDIDIHLKLIVNSSFKYPSNSSFKCPFKVPVQVPFKVHLNSYVKAPFQH